MTTFVDVMNTHVKIRQLAKMAIGLEAYHDMARKGLSRQALAAVSYDLDRLSQMCDGDTVSFEQFRELQAIRSHAISLEAEGTIGEAVTKAIAQFKKWLNELITKLSDWLATRFADFEKISEKAGSLIKSAAAVEGDIKVSIPVNLAQRVSISGDFNEGHFDKLTDMATFASSTYPEAISDFYNELASVLKSIDPSQDVDSMISAITDSAKPLQLGDHASETYPGNVMIVADEAGMNYRVERTEARIVDKDVELTVKGSDIADYLRKVQSVAKAAESIRGSSEKIKEALGRVEDALETMESKAKAPEAKAHANKLATAVMQITAKVKPTNNMLGYLSLTLNSHIDIAKLKIKAGAKEVSTEDYEEGMLKGEDEDFGHTSSVKDEDGMIELDLFDEQSDDEVEVDDLSKAISSNEEYSKFIQAAGNDGMSKATVRAFAIRFAVQDAYLGIEQLHVSNEDNMIEGPRDNTTQSKEGGEGAKARFKQLLKKAFELIRRLGEKAKVKFQQIGNYLKALPGEVNKLKEQLKNYLPNGLGGGKKYTIPAGHAAWITKEGKLIPAGNFEDAFQLIVGDYATMNDNIIKELKTKLGTNPDSVKRVFEHPLRGGDDLFPWMHKGDLAAGETHLVIDDPDNATGELKMRCRAKAEVSNDLARIDGALSYIRTTDPERPVVQYADILKLEVSFDRVYAEDGHPDEITKSILDALERVRKEVGSQMWALRVLSRATGHRMGALKAEVNAS